MRIGQTLVIIGILLLAFSFGFRVGRNYPKVNNGEIIFDSQGTAHQCVCSEWKVKQ